MKTLGFGLYLAISCGDLFKSAAIYFFTCAAIAAAIADFNRSCARPYAAKSPFARAACPSASACWALANALASELLVVPVVVVFPDADVVPEFPPNT